MRRTLLDEGVPVGVRHFLTGYSVEFVPEIGRAGRTSGDLINAAEQADFDIIVTCDKNISYQNNLIGKKLALVVLSTNHWATIQTTPERTVEAVNETVPGGFREVMFDRPPLRRRRFSPSTNC
jgi:hypothetical protein